MKKKYEKYYELSTSLSIGFFLILMGIVIFIGKEKLYKDTLSILTLILLLISIFNFIKYKINQKHPKENSKNLITCIFNLLVSFILFNIPVFLYGLAPFLFAAYLLIISISNFISYIVLTFNKVKRRSKYLISALFYLLISFPILLDPIAKINTFLVCLSIYIILLGIRYVADSIIQITPNKAKNNIKRHLRITLPKILEAIIPYQVMLEINSYLENDSDTEVQYKSCNKKNILPNMYIIVHTSPKGVNKMGHLDLYFNNKVISYGNYDEGSRKMNIFGDGVLFTCDNLNDYINFCIDNSKKTIFLFGITLNSKQLTQIHSKIKEITTCTYKWNYKSDKKYTKNNTYASKLYHKTKAKFYKFKSGKYKTYYVLGTNCCYLVDDIIGKSGLDILSLNGIMTPGTYYDYLSRELHKKNSIVVSKNIYNKTIRPKIK